MITQIDAKAKAIMLFSQISNINYGYSSSVEGLELNSGRIKEIIATDNVASQKINALWDCNWGVVWGPVFNTSVNKAELKPLKPTEVGKYHSDNSMYVVHGYDKNTKKNIYVIAISGTNSLSYFEKKQEDIKVIKTQNWDNNKPEHGAIAEGSMLGLNILLELVDPKQQLNLIEFLEMQHRANQQMEIITCGHSLGGALSPLVALKLIEVFKDIPVSTYPTAGPTSGDLTFAEYAANTFGDNYYSVINTNDIVPMAWENSTLSEIPNIYNKNGSNYVKMKLANKMLLNSIKHTINKNNITYKRIATEREYSFAGNLIFPSCPEDDKKCDLFMMEAMYQHSIAYYNEFFQEKNDSEFIDAFMKLVYLSDRN